MPNKGSTFNGLVLVRLIAVVRLARRGRTPVAPTKAKSQRAARLLCRTGFDLCVVVGMSFPSGSPVWGDINTEPPGNGGRIANSRTRRPMFTTGGVQRLRFPKLKSVFRVTFQSALRTIAECDDT